MKNKFNLVISILFITISLFIPCLLSAEEFIGHLEENTMKVYDSEDNYIFSTTMSIVKGDYYINEENIKYIIEDIDGEKATASCEGKVNLLEDYDLGLTPVVAAEDRVVGLYCTHNGESYQPGPDNVEGHGDIHEITRMLRESLEKQGINVIESENLHLPHDGAAYERSRATALKLTQQSPDAIFDIHRDAVPNPDEYTVNIDGNKISKVQLVVGRQNPNREINNQFAKAFKAVSDRYYPGLVKGIFYGSGNYNQHIAPHTLLLEIGTHKNTKEQAVETAALLGGPINTLLYGDTAQEVRKEEGIQAYNTVFWIIGIFIIGISIYLYIIEGSIQGAVDRLKRFFSKEIIDRGNK